MNKSCLCMSGKVFSSLACDVHVKSCTTVVLG